jgi:addiction module RelE/StbE family toxin
MRIVFHEEALDDLQSIFAWIAKDDLAAAAALIDRIFEKLEKLMLPQLSRIGRMGQDPGTRELIEGPYIVVYEVDERDTEIRVVAVVHGARERT